jgi:putative membrane protein
MKTMLVAAALAASCVALPAFAATDAECQAMWTKADVNKDGSLSAEESMRYSAAMRVRDKQVAADGKLDQASFMESCKADVYTMKKADDGAPLKGANSFTEGQAKDRVLSHGMTNVGGLKKDDDGIWRGSAQQDGKPVQVAVDFKGNVVPQTAP